MKNPMAIVTDETMFKIGKNEILSINKFTTIETTGDNTTVKLNLYQILIEQRYHTYTTNAVYSSDTRLIGNAKYKNQLISNRTSEMLYRKGRIPRLATKIALNK